jgi:[lysine-biosynthesis-protein LysW]--L-2-aminoadipate ligase
LTPALEEISVNAAHAVGGGVLAVDVIEHPDKGYLVNEINHTLEFHTAQPTSGVDIAGAIVDYVIEVGKGNAL